jgi:hypothetical protein
VDCHRHTSHRDRRAVRGSQAGEPGLAARWSIAQLLFDRDFLETASEGEAAPEAALLAEAHYELASVAAQEGAIELEKRAEKWAATRREYDAGQKEEARAATPVLSPARRSLIEGAILMSEGKYEEAVALHRHSLESETDPQYQVALMVQQGAALFALGRDGTEILAQARDRARAMPRSWMHPAQISEPLVRELIQRCDLVRLRSAYRGLLDDLEPISPEYENAVLGYVFQALIRAGDLGAASRVFSQQGLDPNQCRFAAPYVSAEVSLRCLNLEPATRDNAAAVRAGSASSSNLLWRAMALEQKGKIEAAHFELPAAIESFTQAKEQFEKARTASDAANCKMRMSNVAFEISGDTQLALSYLFDITEQQLQADPSLRTFWLARKIRLHLARGEDGEMKSSWRILKEHLENTEKHPALQIMGWTAGAAAGLADAETVSRLQEGLSSIQPPAASIPLLEFFRWADRGYDILEKLPEAPEPDPDAPDWAVQQILVADYDRARGHREEAIARIDRTWLKLGGEIGLPLWLSLMRASRRLGASRDQPIPAGEGTLRDVAVLEVRQALPAAEADTLSRRYPGTIIQARALELQGKIAEAAEIYLKLGLKPYADALHSAHKPASAYPSDEESPLVALELQIVGRELRTVCHVRGQVVGEGMLSGDISGPILGGGFDDLAKALLSVRDYLDIERLLIRRFQDSGLRGDVSLLVPPGRAPAWPWERWMTHRMRAWGLRTMYRIVNPELATLETVRWVQRAASEILNRNISADGVPGPQTLNAVQDLQHQFGIEPTGHLDPRTLDCLLWEMRQRQTMRVAVVLPPRELELRFGRGYGYTGVDLRAAWEAAGCRAEVVESPDAKRLAEGIDADIVHIAASLLEERGEVRLWTHWEPPPSRALAFGLKNATGRRAGYPPFVILDPPRPDSDHEAFRQLVLRNSLGDELFRQQNAGGVIACGLAPESDLAQIVAPFISALATAKVGEAAAIWWQGREDRVMLAALFCHNPHLPAWCGTGWNSPNSAA